MADFYEVLGVDRQASQDDIKKAYRKLARKLHPDVAGQDSADEFKAVTEAYQTLSDPQKRQQYDMGGGQSGGFPGGGFGFQDIFESFFGGGTSHRGPVPRSRRGQDALVRVDLELSEVAFGITKNIPVETAVVCNQCEGSCCQPGTSPQTCSACGGAGMVQRVTNSFLGQVMTTSECSACHGYGTIIPSPCTECSGEGRVRSTKTLTVDVPAGVQTGNRIRLTSQGEVGPAGGPAGDVYVEVRERKHPIFVREGDDLHCRVNLPMTAAALGTQIDLETLDGPRKVEIPAGAQSGESIKLADLGVGKLNRYGRGDILVHLDVQTPTKVNDEQRELLEKLAELRGEERAEGKVEPAHGSMFSRLKEKLAGR